MSTSQNNPPIEEQKKQIRNSSMQKPATDTEHAEGSDVSRASADEGRSGNKNIAPGGDGTGNEVIPQPKERAMLPEDVHPNSADMHNAVTADSTVGTDGKGKDAD